MAGSVNKVLILGRLGRDPEVRNFQNGGKVVNLRVATGERYKDREGNMQEKTEWHSVAIFNEKLGEIAEKYLKKGSQVYLEGQLETRKWQDKDGAEKYSTEVVLRNFRGELTLLDSRGGGAGGGDDDSYAGGGAPAPARAGGGYGGGGAARGAAPASSSPRSGWDNKKSDLDDDIPF